MTRHKDPSVGALVTAYRPHDKLHDEIVRLAKSGGWDPNRMPITVLLKASLQNLADSIDLREGTKAREYYNNLMRF